MRAVVEPHFSESLRILSASPLFPALPPARARWSVKRGGRAKGRMAALRRVAHRAELRKVPKS